MTDDDAFIRSILDSPDDAAPRLVYADWLDERGDPRGEYLRLNLALRSVPSGSPDAITARTRLTELAPVLPLPWLATLDSPAAWDHLRRLGPGVRDPQVFPHALAAARITMERVRQNVVRLTARLPEIGYRFADTAGAHLLPTTDTDRQIADIETAIGPMPLSFRAFYEVVGAVNFCQSLDQLVQWSDSRRDEATEVELLGEEDPLYVLPLDELHRDIMEQHGRRPARGRPGRYARYGWRPGGEERWYCHFAADEFHKANYSGGENYNLFLPDPQADFRIRDLFSGTKDDEEEDREWFVDYLRNVFHGGGFRGKWDETRGKRPPESELIRRLRVGLLEI